MEGQLFSGLCFCKYLWHVWNRHYCRTVVPDWAADILQCFGPVVVAITLVINIRLPFIITTGLAVVSIILIMCFSPKKVKEIDDKYRLAAGKPLDDALVGRK